MFESLLKVRSTFQPAAPHIKGRFLALAATIAVTAPGSLHAQSCLGSEDIAAFLNPPLTSMGTQSQIIGNTAIADNGDIAALVFTPVGSTNFALSSIRVLTYNLAADSYSQTALIAVDSNVVTLSGPNPSANIDMVGNAILVWGPHQQSVNQGEAYMFSGGGPTNPTDPSNGWYFSGSLRPIATSYYDRTSEYASDAALATIGGTVYAFVGDPGVQRPVTSDYMGAVFVYRVGAAGVGAGLPTYDSTIGGPMSPTNDPLFGVSVSAETLAPGNVGALVVGSPGVVPTTGSGTAFFYELSRLGASAPLTATSILNSGQPFVNGPMLRGNHVCVTNNWAFVEVRALPNGTPGVTELWQRTPPSGTTGAQWAYMGQFEGNGTIANRSSSTAMTTDSTGAIHQVDRVASTAWSVTGSSVSGQLGQTISDVGCSVYGGLLRSNCIGNIYCDPAVDPNNPSLPHVNADIFGTGTSRLSNNNLTLNMTGMPSFTFGYFLVSNLQQQPVHANSSLGYFCLAGNVGRYIGPGQVMNSGAAGSISLPIDLLSIPTSTGTQTALVGEFWNFQGWYRQTNPLGVDHFNFSDAMSVMVY